MWHNLSVSTAQRQARQNHLGGVVWFTGLSGSGKSSICNCVDKMLFDRGVRSVVLDGDNLRHGLCATPAILNTTFDEDFANRFGLGFGTQDRQENIRRVGEVCKLFADSGVIVLTAFVSPYRSDRDRVRQALDTTDAENRFCEVFVDTPLSVCEARDPKGLYKKARAGEIKKFTGISDPYEPPLRAELTLINDGSSPLDVIAGQIITLLQSKKWLPSNNT